ncbi:MAG: hypothetical protein AB7E96_08015 [Deferribacterales bacterium]
MRTRLLAVLALACFFMTSALSYAAPAKTPPLLQNDIQKLPADYKDGWGKLGGALLSVAENVYDNDDNKILELKTNTKLGALQISQALKVYGAFDAVYKGEWDKLAGQAADDIITKMWPMLGSYMALHSAVKTSFEAMLANWSQDLYATKAYKNVVNVMNDAVVNQAVNQEPYLPSSYLKPGSDGYKSMKAMEDRMFKVWMNTNPDDELMIKKNKYLLIHVFGKAPKNDREVFDGFLDRAVMDQKSYIMTTYERVREEAMREMMRKYYEKTVADLKKQQKMMFFVVGTKDNYGGSLINGPVGAGDILAFESDLFVPYVYNGEIVQLRWQVFREDSTPVEGLAKVTRIHDGDKVYNARMRFRIDNMPDGRYYTQLSRCVRSECQSFREPFTVGSPLSISRVYLSQDAQGTRRINREPFSREAQFLQADIAGTGTVKGELAVKDASGKTVYQAKNEMTVSKGIGRMSFSVREAALAEGNQYKAEVSVSSGDGQKDAKALSFTPMFYQLTLLGPADTEEGRKTTYSYQVPPQMKAPFRIDTQKNAGEVTQLGGNQLAFTPLAGGNRSLAVVVTDAEGRKAMGFRDVTVLNKILDPISEEQSLAMQPKVTYVPPSAQSAAHTSQNTVPYQNVPNGSPDYNGGVRRLRLMLDGSINEYVSSCMKPYYNNYTNEVVNKSDKREIESIGRMNAYELKQYEENLNTATLNKIKEALAKSGGNSCDKEWSEYLYRRGYVDKSFRDRIYVKNSGGSPGYAAISKPDADYYALMTLHTMLANPDKCEVVKGKPQTGVYNKYFKHISKQDPTRGYETYHKWVVAAGPGKRGEAQKFCDKMMSKEIAVTGNYTPWVPTGSASKDGDYQMPEQEYIMKLPYYVLDNK